MHRIFRLGDLPQVGFQGTRSNFLPPHFALTFLRMTTRGLTKEAVTGVKPGHMSLAKDKVVVVLESHPSGFYFVRRDNETGWIQKSKVTIGKVFC